MHLAHTHTTRDAICSGALAQGYKHGYRYPTRTGKRPGGRRARSEATRAAVSSVCVSNVSPIPPVSPLCLPLPLPAPCVSRRGRTVREQCGNSTGGQRPLQPRSAQCAPGRAQYHCTIPSHNSPRRCSPRKQYARHAAAAVYPRTNNTSTADTPPRAPHKPPHGASHSATPAHHSARPEKPQRTQTPPPGARKSNSRARPKSNSAPRSAVFSLRYMTVSPPQ